MSICSHFVLSLLQVFFPSTKFLILAEILLVEFKFKFFIGYSPLTEIAIVEFHELYWFIEYYYNQFAFFCYFHIKYLLHTHQNPRDYLYNYYLEQESFLISATNIKNFKDLLPDCILNKDNYHKLGVTHFLLHLNNYRIEFSSP